MLSLWSFVVWQVVVVMPLGWVALLLGVLVVLLLALVALAVVVVAAAAVVVFLPLLAWWPVGPVVGRRGRWARSGGRRRCAPGHGNPCAQCAV